MNTNELAKLKQQLAEIGERIKQLEARENMIIVPDCIQIESAMGGEGDDLGIVFDQDRVMYTINGQLKVDLAMPGDRCYCKLVPIDTKALKVDHTYFQFDYYLLALPDEDRIAALENISNYCKFRGNDRSYFVDVDEIYCTDKHYKCWYKVEPLED